MGKRFFTEDQFIDNFGKEMASASELYELRMKSGVKDYSLATYDFDFSSDSKTSLTNQVNFLLQTVAIKLER